MYNVVTIRKALATFMGITLTLILGTTVCTTMTVLGQEQYSFITQWGSTGTGFATFKQPLEITVDQADRKASGGANAWIVPCTLSCSG